MEEKTLDTLNNKAWYRLIKVLFIFLYIIILALVIKLNVDDEKPRQVLDSYNTTISCRGGTTYKAGESGIVFSSESDLSWKNRLKEFCMSSKLLPNEYIKPLDYVNQNYDINFAHKEVGSWGGALLNAFFAAFVFVFIFEIIRRAFYYVILGKIFPKKLRR